MSGSKKRTLSDFLGSSNVPRNVPEHDVPRIDVRTEKWSDLSQQAVDSRALATNNKYKNAATGKFGSVELSHTHGEFKKIVDKKLKLDKHNISTAEFGGGAKSFPKIVNRLSDTAGATDTLRVIKGTHLTKGLISKSLDERRAAVELGTEIGISEYVRGTTVALTDASINLYRVKHGNLSKSDFSDHEKGYSGAGKGGAERLRAFGSIADVFKPYNEPLKEIYDTHAAVKVNRPWETGLRTNATDQEKYDSWRFHKFNTWKQRE